MEQKKSNILIEGYTSFISNLMGNRGITTKEEADFYVHASFDDLRDPFSARGIKEAVDVAEKAIKENKKIAVFGDYDCDGVTSTKTLDEGLIDCGANSIVRLPCRITEGYGIRINAIKELIEQGVELIITVDNGIKAIEEIKYAIERGIQVIVLDHHIVGEKEPEATVVVDLHRENETFGYEDLAGVGVAFLFVRALYKRFGFEDDKCKKLLDLVAIGTIADCVPLTGENRILVREGLKLINSPKYNRKSILTILRRNYIIGHVTSMDIGFKVAPVINAPGRLLINGAMRAFNMLKDVDGKGSDEAEFLMRINEERKELTTEGIIIAEEYLKENNMLDDKVLVLYLENQPEGIIGLISGRLTEKYKKPSLVFTNDAHGSYKASGRCIPGIDLYECLTSCGGLFIKYGGHEQAAGMSIVKENLPFLKEGINLFVEDNYDDSVFEQQSYYEEEIDEDEITPELLAKLDMFEPCGMDNPKPKFKVNNLNLVKKKIQTGGFEKYMVLGQTGLSIVLYGTKIEALGFGLSEKFFELQKPDVVNLYGTIERSFNYGVETYNILFDTIEEPKREIHKGKVDDELLSKISNLAALL